MVQAAYIQRTITIDGDVSDWTSPTDITNNTNPYQFSTDGQDGNIPADDLDDPIGQTGRDLKKFAFTWDANYVYFYVERWASTTNTVDWLFYIDTNADGLMDANDKVFDVNWSGSTGTIKPELLYYSPSSPSGDALSGDGVDMPGSLGSSIIKYASETGGVTSGAGAGVQMESRVAWTDLGFTGPVNMKFHISSTNSPNSLPGSVLDNMDGPAGGQLFPKDLEITKIASVSTIRGLQSFTYTVSAYNSSIDPMTSVTISDVLPSQVTYVSYVADSGTFNDTDADTIPDEWSIASIPSNTTYTLTITVTANVLPVSMNVDNTATLTASTPADEDNSNDSDTVTVTIQPIPQLTIVKYASSGTANPGGVVTYTLDITNTGGDDGFSVVIDDQLSPYVKLKIDNGSGHPFIFTDNPSNPSGLTLGTRTYSDNYGADGYTYTLDDLADGVADGYDGTVTNFNIQMTGTMNKKVAPATGGNFTIQYDVIVK